MINHAKYRNTNTDLIKLKTACITYQPYLIDSSEITHPVYPSTIPEDSPGISASKYWPINRTVKNNQPYLFLPHTSRLGTHLMYYKNLNDL